MFEGHTGTRKLWVVNYGVKITLVNFKIDQNR